MAAVDPHIFFKKILFNGFFQHRCDNLQYSDFTVALLMKSTGKGSQPYSIECWLPGQELVLCCCRAWSNITPLERTSRHCSTYLWSRGASRGLSEAILLRLLVNSAWHQPSQFYVNSLESWHQCLKCVYSDFLFILLELLFHHNWGSGMYKHDAFQH